MTAEKIIEILNANGIEIAIRGGRLVVRPASKLTASMKMRIREQHDALCAHLRASKASRRKLQEIHKWLVSFDMTQRIGKPLKPPEGIRFLLEHLSDEERQAYFAGGLDWRVWNETFGRAVR